MDGATLRRIGLDHALCPYHLGHDMLAWSDVVVGDYHHWFDSHAVLYSLSTARQWRVAVLVDEAHNLVERGRQMYSADLDDAVIDAATAGAPAALRQDLARLRRQWRALTRGAAPYGVLPQLPPNTCMRPVIPSASRSVLMSSTRWSVVLLVRAT